MFAVVYSRDVLANLLRDVRYAARMLRRSPGFTTLAVVTLGLGIGGTTALFSLVDAVLLRPLPYSEPNRLVEIWGEDSQRGGMRVPAAVLDVLRAQARSLQAISTHTPAGGVLARVDGALDIRGEVVSANFVDVYGVAPILGRAFLPEDERAGAPAVMLTSFRFWQQHLGGDPEAIGRTVFFDTVPYTVIGVMPAGFETRFLSGGPVFWTPSAGNPARAHEREIGYEIVARLSPGTTIEQARREIAAIAASVDVPEWRTTGRRIGMVPLMTEVVGDRARALTWLFAAVAVVLAIACANVAQLLLARSDQRLREFTTRQAIGAPRRQLFQLAIAESLLLSLAGGLLGVALAFWLVPALRALAPVEIPRLAAATVDARVLLTALAISLLTGVAFGVTPALRLSRASIVDAHRAVIGARSRQRARFRSALVIVQVSGAVVLVATGGLVVQTFLTLLPASPGFATESRAVFFWGLRDAQFPDPVERRRRLDGWIEQLRAVPGIVAVANGSSIPFSDDESRNLPLRRTEAAGSSNDAPLRVEPRAISNGYLELMQIPLIAGRPFSSADRDGAPRVAIVNQTLAGRLDASGRVLGLTVRLGANPTAPPHQIVGVVADTRWWGTTAGALNEIYTPMAQDRTSFGSLVVESRLDNAVLTLALRTTFYAAFPGAPLEPERRAVPLDELIGRSIAGPRFSAILLSAFSTSGLLLAGIGLFGLVAYSVSQRRQEFGIRAALGAQPADLIAASVRSAVVLTTIGILAGLAGSAYVTRLIETQLYSVRPNRTTMFAAAALVMLTAAAFAAYIPARRAATLDAAKTLKN